MNQTSVVSVIHPDSSIPLLLDFPHSGRHYPDSFGYSIDHQTLRRCEDSYVDQLFCAAEELGICCVTAAFPRSFIDVNRSLSELDLAMVVDGVEPWSFGGGSQGAKLAQGIGLIWSHVNTNPDWPIYDRKLTSSEIAARVEGYWRPYRQTFDACLKRLHGLYGRVYRIACHSMPSYAQFHSPGGRSRDPVLADFNIGWQNGETASREFVGAICSFLEGRGFSVWIDEPYKGHGMVKDYGAPNLGIHSVLLEVNRGLYLREDTSERRPWFGAVQAEMRMLLEHLIGFADADVRRS
jgi:N-formylglutamate deformylase